jgi:hypothetical protein
VIVAFLASAYKHGDLMDEYDSPDDADAGEVIGLASALMEEDRNRRDRVDLKQVGAELGVPAEYVERAESELRRKRAQAKVRFRIVLAAALGIGSVGAWWWNNERVQTARANAAGSQPSATKLRGLVVAFDLHRGSGSERAAAAIQAQGGNAITIDQAFSDRVLAGVDVLALLESRKSAFDEAELSALKRFVHAGKGLIVGDLGWSWVLYEHKPLEDLPVNQLGKALGFAFTNENIGAPGPLADKLFPDHPAIVQHGWAASSIVLTGDRARIILRDEKLRPMAGTLEAGRGRIAIFGHSGILDDNPWLFAWSIAYASRR